MSFDTRISKNWVRAAYVILFPLLAVAFLFPPPGVFSDPTSFGKPWRLGSAIVIAVFVLLCLRVLQNRLAGRWQLVMALLFVVGIISVLWHLEERRTCVCSTSSDNVVVIGSELTQQAADHFKVLGEISCADKVAEFAGKASDVWSEHSIARCERLLNVSYSVALCLIASALVAGIQAGSVVTTPQQTASDVRAMKILFCAANPSETSPLDLEEELRSLEQELRGVKYRDSISLVARHAVRPDDLVRHVRADGPTVLHFSGHGTETGIVLRDDTKGYRTVDGASLRRFLNGRGVDLVVLNSCYSQAQADDIRPAVKAIVGTSAAVGDEAARRFTVAFYRALGDGLSVCEAFRDGGDAVALHGLEDVFHCAGDLDLILLSEAKD